MKALVLAAGLGTRLAALQFEGPKPMLPIDGRPLLEHTVGLLRAHGVSEIAINLHYRAEAVVRHLGDGEAFGIKLVYSWEDRLLGTAGAAKRLERFLDQSFYVIYGDVLTDLDLSSLAAWHAVNQAVLTMALYRVDDPGRVGIVELGAGGRVERFREKPGPAEVSSNLASTGIFVAEPRILERIPADSFRDFGQHLIPSLLEEGLPVYGRPADGYVLDIGSPERYGQALREASAGRVQLHALQPAID